MSGVDIGCEEPFPERPKGTVEFGGDAVSCAELQVGAPFGAVAPDVHRGDASAHGEVDVLRFAAVDFDEGLEERGRVGFFVDADGETALAAVGDDGIGDAVVTADAGEAREDVVERFRVQWLADKIPERLLDILLALGFHTLDAHKLRHSDGTMRPGFLLLEIFGPRRVVE